MPGNNIDEIQKLMPHRYPFLLIDRIVEVDLDDPEGARLVALKNVTINEEFFNGHFPGEPIMPGVLTLEALAQASGILWKKILKAEDEDMSFYLVGADNVRFKRPIVPGDQIMLSTRCLGQRRGFWKSECKATVGGEVVCCAEITCVEQKSEQV